MARALVAARSAEGSTFLVVEGGQAVAEARVGTAVARCVLAAVGLRGGVVERALGGAPDVRLADERLRAEVAVVVTALDEQAWARQDVGDDAGYRRLFAQARAASCLWSALHDDSVTAAADAVYEAQAAVGDLPAVRRVVDGVLPSSPGV